MLPRREHPEEITQFERKQQFKQLRQKIWDEIMQNARGREESGIPPTTEEWSAGHFREYLEPQCVNAVFAIRRKGYNTTTSGFRGELHPEGQYLVGSFKLTDETVQQLKEFGFDVIYEGSKQITWIEFDSNLDIHTMQIKWDQLADILPDLGKPADESNLGNAVYFRQQHPR